MPINFNGKNIAFLDAEYLSARFKKGSMQDVISVGLVVASSDMKELDRFYSTVHPRSGHRVPPLITDITGLTDEELESAPAYEDVMADILDLLHKYHVAKVCVWGGDQNNFRRDFETRFLEKHLKRNISRFIDSFENIQKQVSLDITGGLDANLSLADMKTLCGLGGDVAHNALSDAKDLYDCIRIYKAHELKYDGRKAAEYKRFRGEYVKNRSFDDSDEEFIVDSKFGEGFLKELTEKGFAENPKTKAFMDDLRFLLGGGNIYMGTFAEMMEEKKSDYFHS